MTQLNAHVTYWQQKLAGAPPALALPCDFPRPPVPSFIRSSVSKPLGSELSARLASAGEEWQVAEPTIVFAAWQAVLRRYTGQDDLILWFMGNRAAAEPATLKLCPWRATLGDQWSGVELIEKTAERLAEMAEHSSISADALAELLNLDSNRNLPILNSAFIASSSVRAVAGEAEEFLAQCDIVVSIDDADAGLQIECDYDAELFRKETISRMLVHVRMLLTGMLASSQTTISQLPMLTDIEYKHLTASGKTAPAFSVRRCLHELFEAQAERSPDAIALTCGELSLSYAQLNQSANRLAHQLRQCGVGPNLLVGLYLERSNELVIAILAILKAGGAYLPIDLSYPPERIAFMLADSSAAVLLTHSRLQSKLPVADTPIVKVDELLADAQNTTAFNLSPAACVDDLAYVIYTSGTTGKPKGALVTHRNVARLFSATEDWFGFHERDVWTLFHSSAFDFSVWEIWGALLYGGRLVVVPYSVSRAPDSFYKLLAREKVTVLNQTPSAFRQLLRAEESIGQRSLSLRYVIFGGEALEMESLRPWFERHGDQQPQLVNMYGITETTVHVTYRPLTKSDVGGGSVIGVPIPDLRVYILDPQGHPVPIGIPGEMFVGGAGVCAGYLRRDELTAERFLDDRFSQDGGRLYRTGDQVRWLASGDIEYLGRIDHQVKIRGFRIELSEIETVLAGHASVRECIVLARQDTAGEKRLMAYVVRKDRASAGSVSELRRHLQLRLPDYMVPASFVFLDKFSLTTNGKVDRDALPAPDDQRPELADRYVEPRTQLEEQLAAIWRDVLRIDRVGVHDNYFELGGDSIQSTLVVSAARKLDLRITPKQLFECPTIAQLASVTVRGKDARVIDQGPSEGDSPLTPIQHWFFEQRLADPHHYNQAFLFEVRQALDEDALRRAMDVVQHQHDVLRLRFWREAGCWHQEFAAPGASQSSLEQVDLSTVPAAQISQEIARIASGFQASLNLESGPLWRVVAIQLAKGSCRLLVIVHHLAIDGVSWRILMADLEKAYQQAREGDDFKLLPKTTSFQHWAERLQLYAESGDLAEESVYWNQVASLPHAPIPQDAPFAASGNSSDDQNTEATANTITVRLTDQETRDLLQRVPQAYNTMINDVLLTALAQSIASWTGRRQLLIHLEGHGREDLFEGFDLTRTLGWFTTIYPVHLELPESRLPEDSLKAVKEQLRSVPQRGIGYGVLRYLTGHAGRLSSSSTLPGLSSLSEPDIVFNYFGKFDDVVRDSQLFEFAEQNTGRWHSTRQQRQHALEVNSMIIGGRLEIQWTYSTSLHRQQTIETIAEEFLKSLRDLIQHCVSRDAGGYTPSDFPLCGLDQSALDRLVAGSRDIEDVYPPSPLQLLFLARAASQNGATLDHWQCTLSGKLDIEAFRRAWQDVFDCHPILRTSVRSEGLSEPLQVVQRQVPVPWTINDWSGRPAEERQELWQQMLREDRALGMELDRPPLSRFALVRLDANTHGFLWSVPSLLLDGWSWPLVFADVSKAYQGHVSHKPVVLEKSRTYREYLVWLQDRAANFDCRLVDSDGKHDASPREFWQANMEEIREPTPLLSESPTALNSPAIDRQDPFARVTRALDHQTIDLLQKTVRTQRTTIGALVQAAWSIVLSRLSSHQDIIFGAAFSGRPTDLAGAETMVGPFVNNLPVRVQLRGDESLGELLTAAHNRLLQLNPYQFVPSTQIQSWSGVPWKHRLFDSLVVVQNYVVHESARRLGPDVVIENFDGPIHTNFPLLILVEPDSNWRISLIYDRRVIAPAASERWTADLIQVLQSLGGDLDAKVDAVMANLSRPISVEQAHRKLFVQSQNYIPPRTAAEKAVARVWQDTIRLDRISIEENLFDLGVHSLLVVQLHQKLQDALGKTIGLVTLFRYPTIYALAQYLDSDDQSTDRLAESRNRGHRQRQMLASLKSGRSRIKR